MAAGSTPPPPQSPDHPVEVHPGKSKTMIYAVVTLGIVIIAAVIVTFMTTSSKQQPAPQETAQKEQTVPPTSTPSVMPTPSTVEEQIEAVNTTTDDSDLQQADKDLQSL